MAEQMRPASNAEAPDPSSSYERSHPDREAGMGRLDNNKATPTDSPDHIEQAVGNKQDGSRQINAHETENRRADSEPTAAPPDRARPDRSMPDHSMPDHSMKEEEPMGWDQAPTNIHDPQRQRQPRTEGKGGTP